MVCGYFILPEPASYVFFYAIFNLRNLFYLIIAEQPEQFKMAIVIGNVLGKYQLGISDVWISNRIDKMLEDGVLEIIQDAPKGETNYRRILRKRMK